MSTTDRTIKDARAVRVALVGASQPMTILDLATRTRLAHDRLLAAVAYLLGAAKIVETLDPMRGRVWSLITRDIRHG